MLKMTGIKLEQISDMGKYLFIEKGWRGRVSYIGESYAKANNKYTGNYDLKKQSIFITYLDMIGLWVSTFLMVSLSG